MKYVSYDSLCVTCHTVCMEPLQILIIARCRLASKVANTLHLEQVTRADLDTLYICQASNNNISAPLSASVKIDILGETGDV